MEFNEVLTLGSMDREGVRVQNESGNGYYGRSFGQIWEIIFFHSSTETGLFYHGPLITFSIEVLQASTYSLRSNLLFLSSATMFYHLCTNTLSSPDFKVLIFSWI